MTVETFDDPLSHIHIRIARTFLPSHLPLSWQRNETEEDRKQRDQFFAFEFQKLWPWQRQNIWKKAEV